MAVDFIKLNDIVDEITTYLRDTAGVGAAIETFCQANYSSTITVFDQPDATDPPGETDAPYVSIYRNGLSMGEEVATWRYELELEIGVNDPSVDNNTANVYKQTGIRNLEELSYIIYDVVRTNIPCNANITEAELDLDETNHPLYLGYLKVIISVPQVIGSVIGL